MKFRSRTVVGIILATTILSSFFTWSAVKVWEVGQNPAVLTSSLLSRDGLTKQETDKLNSIMGLIDQQYIESIDRSKLIDGAIEGMMNALDDPYSTYMNKEVSEEFNESIEGSFSGIGAEIAEQDGQIIVVTPIKNSPADKAGLLARDVILSVNNTKLEGLSVQEAVSKIRGPKGSEVILEILRGKATKSTKINIIRDDITIETVKSKMLDNKSGLIEITQFSQNTAEAFLEQLAALEKAGMTSLVIDVRNNPGGVLTVVSEIAEQFVPKGKTIVQVQGKKSTAEKTISKGSGKSYPVAVLINGGSASASEILAAALQEAAGATIVGETSFGKGTVQVGYDQITGDGSLIKLTIAKWLTPNGNWIHKKGVKPDVQVSPPDFYSVTRISDDATLKYDIISDDVQSLQIMLDALGYKVDRKDGYFSKLTEAAVKQAQSNLQLPVTGIVDAKTANAIELKLLKVIDDASKDVQLQKALDIVRK